MDPFQNILNELKKQTMSPDSKFLQGNETNNFLTSLERSAIDASNHNKTVRDNPWSSLVPYDELEASENARLEKSKKGEQNIIKTNALGDAISLLFQAVGANKGATIEKKGPNQHIINAYNRTRQLDDQTRERLDQWRMFDINNQIRGITANMGLEAEARERKFRKDQSDFEMGFRADEAEKDRGFKTSTLETGHENTMKEIAERGAWQVENTKSYGDRTIKKETWGFNDPSTGEKVSITPDTERNVLHIINQLYPDPNNYPPILRAMQRGEVTRDQAIQQIIIQDWDRIKPHLETLEAGNPLQVQQQQEKEKALDKDDLDTHFIKKGIRKLDNAGFKREGLGSLGDDDFETELLGIVDNKDLGSDNDRRSMIAALLVEMRKIDEKQAKAISYQYIPKKSKTEIAGKIIDISQGK